MRKFFISFRNGDQMTDDPEGFEAHDVREARQVAIDSLLEITGDGLKHRDGPIPHAVMVFDHLRRKLLTVETKDVLPPPLK
jgi:hypothetical protein